MLAAASGDPLHGVNTIFGIVLTGVGAIFLLVGLVILSAGRRRRRGITVAGRIVGYGYPSMGIRLGPARLRVRVSQGTSAGYDIEHPIVEFQTAAGEQITGMARNGTSPRPGRVGAPIRVSYRPKDPQIFFADTRWSRAASGLIGFVFSGIGLFVVVLGLEVMS